MKTPTLDEIEAQLDAQEAELLRLAEVAKDIPPGRTVPESALEELDELARPRLPASAPPTFAIRA